MMNFVLVRLQAIFICYFDKSKLHCERLETLSLRKAYKFPTNHINRKICVPGGENPLKGVLYNNRELDQILF